jgi:hypothetical protein
MVVMNERWDLVISIKRLTGKKPEPTLTPEPMLTPEPTLTFEPTPTPKFSSTPTPKGFENIHQEFEFKVTIDKENLEDFIEGLKESAEADDIKLLPGGLMLWAETEGFSSEKIDVLSNRLETYDLMVPIPIGQSIGKPMTFHLGVLTKNKPFALGSKSSFNLNFDVLGRDDKKLLRDSILLKLKPETNDDWFIAILNHPERIFVGLLVMLYGISLLISREVRSMSWTAIRFFLPSSRLESKQVMDRLDGIQDALGSTNYLRQPNSGSSRQRSETSDALETGLRDLKAEIQRNTGTINTLQQRLSSELDKDSASRQAADALPGAERERRDLSDKIISLGELLRNSVAEIVAEQALANASEYWAVEDRKQLLARISVHLEEQEAKRLENLEHISDTIRQLRALNVRQSLQKIEDLSRPEMAGIENSETIAAILDDMLASVPRRPIRPEIIEQIDAFSSHVEGLGITSRFIPGALVEICRELVADSSPEEVDRIEIIISRVIESARARF